MLAIIPFFAIRPSRHSMTWSQILPSTTSFQLILANSCPGPAAHKLGVPPVQAHTREEAPRRPACRQPGGPGRPCTLNTQVHTRPCSSQGLKQQTRHHFCDTFSPALLTPHSERRERTKTNKQVDLTAGEGILWLKCPKIPVRGADAQPHPRNPHLSNSRYHTEHQH